MLLRGH
ncbi:Mitotic checkpoint serine/threonine-protein kinase BUB1 [Pseudolycoriella hygida]|nr:Mitotic checkpoint serine/threonine-protein kinase BUB1 [Pseudolycoriella hygida]